MAGTQPGKQPLGQLRFQQPRLRGPHRTPQRQGDLQHLPIPMHLGEECGGDTSLLVPPWGGTVWGQLGAGAGDDAGSSLQGAGAGHPYWVQGTYTGFWAPILGAAAEHQVLSACGWVLVQGAGIGIMVLGRVPVLGSWCQVGCQFGDYSAR